MIKNPTLIIAILTGLNLLNYLDRYVLAAVGEPMQKELGFSDTQLGLVGQAFLVSYLITSPIFGRLGDVLPRKVLIAAGVMVWSVATVVSGIPSTFYPIWAARAFVGVGEASYASLSPTVLDDLTPPERKGRVLAIFFAAIPVGSALGFVIGGLLEKYFGWRWAFFLAGAPGALLALLCLLMVEPARRGSEEGKIAEAPHSLAEDLKALWRSSRYVWAVVGFTAQTFALGGFSYWAPKLLVRAHHYDNAEGNMIFGGIVVVTGFAGTFLGGYLSDRIKGLDRGRVALMVCTVPTVLIIPICFWSLFAGSPTVFFLTNAVAQLGIFISTSPLNAVLLDSVPPRARATAMGLSIFVGHLLGDMISVLIIGVLSDRWQDLAWAMIVLPVAVGFNAIAWWLAARAPEPSFEPQPAPTS